MGIAVPFALYSKQDLHDPAQVIAFVDAAGLGLPDRDYYWKPEARFVEARAQYRDHVAKTFVLAAKTASGTLIAFITLLIVFGFAIGVFGVRVQGSAIGFALVLLSIAMMTSTFGLLIATLGRTPEATRGISIFAVLIMVMLGGAWVPTFVFPAWLQRATVVVPARWAVDGIEAMTWRGLSLAAAVPTIGALLGFALLFGVLAALRFDWEAP